MLYTKVLHQARKHLKISTNDYCVADEVNRLCGPSSKVPGWCTKGKEKIAEDMDLTRQAIIGCVDRLMRKGLVERQPKTNYLRTTIRWKETIRFYEAQLSQQVDSLEAGLQNPENGVKNLDTQADEIDGMDCQDSLQSSDEIVEGVKKVYTLTGEVCKESLQVESSVKKVYTFIGHLGVNFLYSACQDSLRERCKESLHQGVKNLDTYIYSIDIKFNTERENTRRRLLTKVENKDTESVVVVEKKEALALSESALEAEGEKAPDSPQPPSPPTKPKTEKRNYGDGALQKKVNQFYRDNPDKYPLELGIKFLEWYTEEIQNSDRPSDIGKERWRTMTTFTLAKKLAEWYERYLEDQKIAAQKAHGSSQTQNASPATRPNGHTSGSGIGTSRPTANHNRSGKRIGIVRKGLFGGTGQNDRDAPADGEPRTIRINVDADRPVD